MNELKKTNISIDFLTELHKKNRQTINTRKYLDKLREKNLNTFGNKCELCNETKNLEFHHITPALIGRGRGSYNRYNEVRKNPELFKLLCKKCHDSI